jgi:hypothetical protein
MLDFMSTKLSLALAFAAGLTGGMLSSFLTPARVLAQTPAAPPGPLSQGMPQAEIRARKFVLVDAAGNSVGIFTTSISNTAQGGAAVVLQDEHGREIWRAGGGFRSLSGR